MAKYNSLNSEEKKHTMRAVLDDMLAEVPSDLNKSELAPVSIALAPSAAQNIETRIYADNIMDATAADTATGESQTRKYAEHGVNRYLATSAIWLGAFTDFNDQPTDILIGTVFGNDGIKFIATEHILTGLYKLKCQTAGEIGNNYKGSILPIDNVSLGSAELIELLEPGEDEEPDEEFRERFYRVVNARPFGGNVPQYEELLRSFAGVGDVKVFPVPNNQGGRVHLTLIGPANSPILSEAFLKSVEAEIDPEPKGKGYGHAPINHYVTFSTVSKCSIDVAATLYLQEDFSISALQPAIEKVIISYLSSLVFKDNIVRIARIEAAILGVDGVRDISGTTVNGQSENITLPAKFDDYQIPTIGVLTLVEG